MSYIGTQPVPQSLESRQEFTATASQTTFATSGYTVGYVDVYWNGVKLSTSDFTATNGSDVVLGSGAAAGDVLAVVMKNDHSDLVALPITDSAGNNVLSESGGTVTLTADEANVGSNALVVDSSGNVGVNTSSVVASDVGLEVRDKILAVTVSSGDSRIFLGGSTSPNHSAGQIRYDTSGNSLEFYANSAERMRIDSSGNVNINNLGSGDVYATSGTLYISSDIRLKNDLGVIDESAIEIIKQLTPRYYSWKDDESSRQQLGFFAQEVFPILPEAVPRDLKYEQNGVDENGEPILEQVLDDNGEPDYQWGFATQPIVAMCVKAIQEQQTLIESQQSQIDALTAKTQEQDLTIASLISRIETLETT
jgi:hypothetical protein